MPRKISASQRQVVEWSYTSGKTYDDPFNEVELDVLVALHDGDSWRVPAFWAGDQEWRVRFAPPRPGRYEIRTICSDEANGDLHDRRSTLEASPHQSANPLLRHGPLRIAPSGRWPM